MMDCVFCTRADQPPPLFETRALVAQPDKFPVRPGHMLVISKAHLPCYGAATAEVHQELDAAAAKVRRFLAEAYRAPALAWENGISGQTVHHAHLHLVPLALPAVQLPGETLAPWEQEFDATSIDGWDAVRTYFACHRAYFYAGLPDGRRLLPAGDKARVMWSVEWIGRATGIPRRDGSWIKTATPADVPEVARRWRMWAGAGSRRTGTTGTTATVGSLD